MLKETLCVVIPTLNAEKYLPSLLDSLYRQTIRPQEVIVVDSQSEDATCRIAAQYGATVMTVARTSFDHGGTRNDAARKSSSDYIVFMSQDALPEDEFLLESLLSSFSKDEKIAAAYARQIAYEDADEIERLTRAFNYPEKSQLKTLEDVDKMGVKAFFFSDVCSIYKRSVFEEMGGFESPILTNEDMQMAYRLLQHRYKTFYQSEAKVYHSHQFTKEQHYKRNFDVGAFLRMHPMEVRSEKWEGLLMVMNVMLSLLCRFQFIAVYQWIIICFNKWKGNRDGRRFPLFTKEEIMAKSNNKVFWQRFFDK